MGESIKEVIRKRRSVRSFDGEGLSEEDIATITERLGQSDNPFGVKVEFKFLESSAHKLTSPVIVGEKYYVAAKADKTLPLYEVAFGYSFEKFCLLAAKQGFGTVMLAATLSRKTFEQALELSENEIMPVASPVGRVGKMSVREKLMRKGVKADKRLPFNDLFFDGDFNKALSPDKAGKFFDALEAVRLAPSAVNKQPWRAVVDDDKVRFYEKRSINDKRIDIQRVDIGIACAHFDLVMQEGGYNGSFVVEDSVPTVDAEYVVTYKFD